MCFPGGSDGSKEPACNVEDLDSIPGLGRSPGGPLQHSCLANSMQRGTWQAQESCLENSMQRGTWQAPESDMTERLSTSTLKQSYNYRIQWRVRGLQGLSSNSHPKVPPRHMERYK